MCLCLGGEGGGGRGGPRILTSGQPHKVTSRRWEKNGVGGMGVRVGVGESGGWGVGVGGGEPTRTA